MADPYSMHYANLSRGVLCPCLPPGHGYVRIQSTACEQKRWGQVALSLGPDVLVRLRRGVNVVIHDVSEKPRVTRAMWQGVPWIRYALRRAWGLPGGKVVSRSGMDVTSYADECWKNLPHTVRKELAYFKKFGDAAPGLWSCDEW